MEGYKTKSGFGVKAVSTERAITTYRHSYLGKKVKKMKRVTVLLVFAFLFSIVFVKEIECFAAGGGAFGRKRVFTNEV